MVKKLTGVLSALVLLAACGGTSAASKETVTVEVPTTITVTASEVAPPSVESSAVAPSAAAGSGTREQPIPAGTPATLGDWTITFDPTNTNAGEIVAAENQFNDPAPEGRQFVMVKVNATYAGEGSKMAAVDLRIQFVGSAGNSFGSSMDDNCGVIPDQLIDTGEVFAGATASGNECVSVPVDQIAGGAWSVKVGFDSDGTFFALS